MIEEYPDLHITMDAADIASDNAMVSMWLYISRYGEDAKHVLDAGSPLRKMVFCLRSLSCSSKMFSNMVLCGSGPESITNIGPSDPDPRSSNRESIPIKRNRAGFIVGFERDPPILPIPSLSGIQHSSN